MIVTEKFPPGASRIWDHYAKIFEELWGLPPEVSLSVGTIGGYLFDAEFTAKGLTAYHDSIILPIRNAAYSCLGFAEIVEYLYEVESYLESPILDFGAGVGVISAILSEGGHEVIAYDLPGTFQNMVLKRAAQDFGFEVTNAPLPQGIRTVFCRNVLEHLEHPLPLVQTWLDAGLKVVANCDLSIQADHIAPMAERQAVIKLLTTHGILLRV